MIAKWISSHADKNETRYKQNNIMGFLLKGNANFKNILINPRRLGMSRKGHKNNKEDNELENQWGVMTTHDTCMMNFKLEC